MSNWEYGFYWALMPYRFFKLLVWHPKEYVEKYYKTTRFSFDEENRITRYEKDGLARLEAAMFSALLLIAITLPVHLMLEANYGTLIAGIVPTTIILTALVFGTAYTLLLDHYAQKHDLGELPHLEC